ncbi:MAG: DNA topoisomerase IV subunit A [Spirochaetales bacterium]|nr:DNA topoisomerase IV subunit A [Spirochaetales bacterium]
MSIKDMIGSNFIEYASYVIKDRAIPDIDDGLKPVQRRILHSMDEMDDGKFNKVANVIGNTMKYHPHGDQSIGGSLVVLANKDYFIEKQGNFGNIFTGDDASAPRYIECRLSPLAKEVLFNKEITEYVDSYDGRNKEPVTLPAKVPVLLMMGTEGIAVGMTTKILPHNFGELLAAEIAILQNKDFEIYPDFPQGGIIDVTEYAKGNGKVKIRAKIEMPNDKTLLIKEIPFGTTTESLIGSIENAAKKNQIKISSINDYTAEKVEIEIKPGRGETAADIEKALYAYTDCEVTLSVSCILIMDNKPVEMTVDDVLRHNAQKLVVDLEKELNIEKHKLTERLQDMTLEQIFIKNRIYKKIEELKTYEEIIATITKELNKFKKLFIRDLTIEDIERLLEIKIKRISRFDIENHRRNMDDIVRKLEEIEINLKNVVKYTIKYIQGIQTKYAKQYPRKTQIKKFKTVTVKEIEKDIDVNVYWDKKGGFLGTDVKSDTVLTALPGEKFLVICKDATYKVVGIESKIFIDTTAMYVEKFDEKKVFCLIYTDLATNTAYSKKFKIEKFLTNKVYNLSPSAKGRIEYLSVNPKQKVVLHYVKKPKQKINEEPFSFADVEIKGYGIKGNKVCTGSKELESVSEK